MKPYVPKSCGDCPMQYDSIECKAGSLLGLSSGEAHDWGSGDGNWAFDEEAPKECPIRRGLIEIRVQESAKLKKGVGW